jgi:O-antigen/teichoic acid export membrane protein
MASSWPSVRDAYIAAHPHCERCLKPAVEVHIRDGRLPSERGRNAWGNLEALCGSCHRQATDRALRRAARESRPRLDAARVRRPSRVRRFVDAIRADALTRSSGLLVADYLFIGLIGGLCSVIMARGWSTHDVGAVVGIAGAVSLIITASSSGIASTITRFLGSEHDQRRFVLEAILLGVSIGLLLAAVVSFVPGHLGVPVHNLGVSDPVVFCLIAAYVTCSIVVSVTDPAFLSRKEVSYAVAKDVTASIARIALMFALLGTGAVGLFGASIGYVAIGAFIDLGLIAWRLRNRRAHSILRFQMMRERVRFAVGSHSAALVAAVPSALVVTIVAAHLGAKTAAYVGIPLAVATYITIIPTMTAQALLAELTDTRVDVPGTAARALRLSYAGTLPAAAVIGLAAPYVLLVYGHNYSAHGADILRWAAAATIFSTFNYLGDTVLLARQKIAAYNAVNVLGSAAILLCVIAAVMAGRPWIGPALFVGQALYASASITMLLRYGTVREAVAAAKRLRWRINVA